MSREREWLPGKPELRARRMPDREPELPADDELAVARAERALEDDGPDVGVAANLDVRALAPAHEAEPDGSRRLVRVLNRRGRRCRRVAAAELPGDDDEGRERCDARQRKNDNSALDRPLLSRARPALRHVVVRVDDVARVVLVH